MGLAEMHDVVAGLQPDEQVDALATAFAVDAKSGPVGDREPLPQGEVPASVGLERAHERFEILFDLVHRRDPQGLVVPDDVRLFLGRDPPEARRRDQLRVGEMRDALEDRPFAGLGRNAQQRTRGGRHGPGGVRTSGEHDGRILVAEGREQRSAIRVRIRDRIECHDFLLPQGIDRTAAGILRGLPSPNRMSSRDPP